MHAIQEMVKMVSKDRQIPGSKRTSWPGLQSHVLGQKDTVTQTKMWEQQLVV